MQDYWNLTAFLKQQWELSGSNALLLMLGGVLLCILLPYLIGSIPGGLLAMKLSGKVPVTWLHKTLGILILWGGIRYLC